MAGFRGKVDGNLQQLVFQVVLYIYNVPNIHQQKNLRTSVFNVSIPFLTPTPSPKKTSTTSTSNIRFGPVFESKAPTFSGWGLDDLFFSKKSGWEKNTDAYNQYIYICIYIYDIQMYIC